jgi:hypothetical protein
VISRRGFLTRLIAAPVIALTILRAPIRAHWLDDLIASPSETGISMRFIQSFDVTTASAVNRLDVLYGVATLQPNFIIRVTEYPWWDIRRWLA